MAAITGRHAITDSVLKWLGKLGIETEGIRRVAITFDPADVVTISVEKYMQSQEVGPFRELLETLTPELVLTRERYRIEPMRADDEESVD